MNVRSQQLLKNCTLVEDYDERLTKNQINAILIDIFNEHLSFIEYGRKKIPVIDNKVILLCSQITYLGNPHPIFKKRIQIKKWYKECLNSFQKNGMHVLFIGVYKYKDNIVFCDFDTKLYISKKMHNSSAHVYINDLYKGMDEHIFIKTDKNGNLIKVIDKDNFANFILSKKTEKVTYASLLNLINDFNNSFDFNKQIWAIDAIKEMHDNNFKKWKETEWAGWYVEYKFDLFTKINSITSEMKYINNSKKDDKKLDFDIEFPKYAFFGDLKSSSIEKTETMLNDADNVMHELEQYGKLWYLIYEHETIKDKQLNGHPMTKARLEYIRQIDSDYKKGDDLSYLSRMKAAVKFKKMFIVEINKINIGSLLDKMTSNFHQPDKKTTRKPKFKLTKSNIENAIIYRYPN